MEAAEILALIYSSFYFFLPAYVANTLPGILGHGRPLDLGHNFLDGRRILGNGVTVRGTAVGVAGGTIVGYLQGDVVLGFLMGAGAMAGDALGSFIKRRLGLERGEPAPLMDQLNFVVGGLVFASFVTTIPLDVVIVLFVITPFGHRTVNWIGYKLHMKDVPW